MNSNFQRLRQKLKTSLFIHHEEEHLEDQFQRKYSRSVRSHSPLCSEDEQVKQNLITPTLSVHSKSFEDEYIMGDMIGQGFHAVVKICQCKLTERQYAVKVLRTSDQEIMSIMKTTFVLASLLEHPNIIKHYQLFISGNRGVAHMIMDYSAYPSIEDLIKLKFQFTERITKILFRNIFHTLNYLHNKGICHRDIKPDNILMDPKTGDIKIIDFGVASRFVQSEPGSPKMRRKRMMTQTGNFYYRAPEVFWQVGYKANIDLWAAGVTLYQLLCGELPFQQSKIVDMIEVLKDESKYQYHKNTRFQALTLPCQDLIKRLLQPKPEKRLRASYALRHPWLLTMSSKNQMFTTKDDIQVEVLKRLDKSDNFSQKGLTTSDQIDISLDNRMIDKIFREQPNGDNKLFKELLSQFKYNFVIENIFIDRKKKSKAQIKFIESIQSSNLQSYKHSVDNTPSKSIMEQLCQNITFCDSDENLSIDDPTENLEKIEIGK